MIGIAGKIVERIEWSRVTQKMFLFPVISVLSLGEDGGVCLQYLLLGKHRYIDFASRVLI